MSYYPCFKKTHSIDYFNKETPKSNINHNIHIRAISYRNNPYYSNENSFRRPINYKYFIYKYNSDKKRIYDTTPLFYHQCAAKIQSLYKAYKYRRFFTRCLAIYYYSNILFNILNTIFIRFYFNKFITNLCFVDEFIKNHNNRLRYNNYFNKNNDYIYDDKILNINLKAIPKIFLKKINYPILNKKVLSNSFSIINNESKKKIKEENKKIKELEKQLKTIQEELKNEIEEKRKIIIEREYMKMELMHLRIDVINVKNENKDLERLNEKYLNRIEKLQKGENIENDENDFKEEEEILKRFKPFARIKYRKFNKNK